MSHYRRFAVSASLALAICCVLDASGSAQTVTIQREGLALMDPLKYNVPLKTTPIRSVEVAAPCDGFVRQVHVAPGQKVVAQDVAITLDDTRQKMLVERARVLVQAARIEIKIAEGKKDAEQRALAEAKVEAAQIDLKLAELELERTMVKLPFAGELFRIPVTPGQFVRTGEPLMTLADSSSLLVELPIDRATAKPGAEFTVSIEQTPAKGRIQALLPPDARFEPLRTLVPGLGSAIVQIENPKGEFLPGQTVFSELIPRAPFAQIPAAAVGKAAEGSHGGTLRQVQVLRKGVIRDIPVTVLTQPGPDKAFVAGSFSPDDELIVSSSQALKDGQQVRLQTASAPDPAAAKPAEAVKPASGL